MILTSSYSEWKSPLYNTFSISGDRGKDANYHGACYIQLAPARTFWRTWKDNIGKVPEEENNRYYVQEYWQQVLSKLNPEQTYKELDNSVLLCYEPNTKFCHRHLVAAWFELLLGVTVREAKSEFLQVEYITKPEFIKQYLEDAMRQGRNMRGFHSLRALYLFEKAQDLELKADELEYKTGRSYDSYRQQAFFLRCDADMIEDEYLLSNDKHD